MSKNFLVGNFLPAHGTSFGKMDRKPSDPSLDRTELEKKFERRSRVRSERETSYIDAVADLPPPPPPSDDDKEVEEPEVFISVEQMPEMVGGMAALNGELDYPEAARRAGIDGTVVVQVIVDENGNPTRPSVVRSVHDALDEEAIRAVMEMSFTPGKQRNRPVRVRTNVPVRFRLV